MTSGGRRPGGDSLVDTALLFLRLGTTAFGGPAAHIAVMEDEVVRRRAWLTRDEFLDYLGATNFIPGPNSTELAIHIGMARHGWPGLLLAGSCFILPSAIIVGLCAWAYVRYGALPQVAGLFHGITPVVIAIIVLALWSLGRSAVKSAGLGVLGLVALGALMAGAHELVVLFAAGLLALVSAGVGRGRRGLPVVAPFRRSGRRRQSRRRRALGQPFRSRSGPCSRSSRASARCCSAAGTC